MTILVFVGCIVGASLGHQIKIKSNTMKKVSFVINDTTSNTGKTFIGEDMTNVENPNNAVIYDTREDAEKAAKDFNNHCDIEWAVVVEVAREWWVSFSNEILGYFATEAEAAEFAKDLTEYPADRVSIAPVWV